MKKVKYLIVGAGVSGLTFAGRLKPGSDYLIIEKESDAGGYCRTIKRNGFIWDYAGHFFHFARPEIKNYFNSKIDENEMIEKIKSTHIYFDNNLIDFPFQKNIHQLDKTKFIDCLYDLFNKSEKDSYCNFEDMLYGKFGKSITEYFLKPYNEKLYACNLNSLDVDAMGRFFPYANKEDIINNMKDSDNSSYNTSFKYPKGGAEIFVKALLDEVDENKILYNTLLENIDIENKIARIDGVDINYEYIVNSMPFDRLLKTANQKNNSTILSSNIVHVFNIGFNKKSDDYKNEHWIYYPQKEISFYRVGFYDNILDQERLSLYVELGFESSSVYDESTLFDKVLEDLRSVGVISDHEVVDYESIRMNPAYVHVSKGSESFKKEMKLTLESKGIYTIGRYGDWKYCSIEDSMFDAIELLKRIG
ncbi:protoporphyrinogen/coproporphyrinogen oxidase [Vibrio lentus]|uniref:protoporphyrinogen/coproporphyrinogen oxidase n=1 Tax=Vibrio lentus TaxID=136468 RepID=UPI000C83D250|nr:NAD(P)-binding protein [Vibrio lentus]PMG99009.1 LPS biosynthesis protein [Vibrio lentus]